MREALSNLETHRDASVKRKWQQEAEITASERERTMLWRCLHRSEENIAGKARFDILRCYLITKTLMYVGETVVTKTQTTNHQPAVLAGLTCLSVAMGLCILGTYLRKG